MDGYNRDKAYECLKINILASPLAAAFFTIVEGDRAVGKALCFVVESFSQLLVY